MEIYLGYVHFILPCFLPGNASDFPESELVTYSCLNGLTYNRRYEAFGAQNSDVEPFYRRKKRRGLNVIGCLIF